MNTYKDCYQDSDKNKPEKQIQSALKIEESDMYLLANPKLYLLILMYVFSSKDELYYFLVRIGKKHGLWYLRNFY